MALAARGSRNMDDGDEKIEDESLVKQLRDQAQKVQREAIIFTIVVEVLILLIP